MWGESASAQLLHLDPVPWTAPTDSLSGPALEIELSHFEEPKFGWSADRVLLTLRLPVSPGSGFFVRMPHATFDFAEVPLFARWPWLQGAEEPSEFWTERRVSSFGQLEVGGDRRADWPWIGPFALGGAIGLPVGTDRLYPLSSVSFPVRAEARKHLRRARRQGLDLDLGWLYHIASGADRLDGEVAFPSGWHAGLAVRLGTEQGRRLLLDFDYQDRDDRISQRLGAALVMPWTARGSFTARVDRELAGTLDRFAAWRLSIAWRFNHRALEILAPDGEAGSGPLETGAQPDELTGPQDSR